MSADRRSFVDTNILVYAHDTASGGKHDRARSLVADLWQSRTGCLSIQVLQEFFVTVTRRIADPLDASEAAEAVSDYARWTLHAPRGGDVLSAIELHVRYAISFWDALILRSAEALACDILYSEDLSAGQRYSGVLVVNPFAENGR